MNRASALAFGFALLPLVALAPSASAAPPAPAQDPHVAMCIRDGKSVVEGLERAKTSRYLENDADRETRRLSQFEEACITGPKATAVKSLPGYADVTAVHGQAKKAAAELKTKVDAAKKAEEDAARKRQEADEKRRADEAKQAAAESAAQDKKREEERAAEKARRLSEDRAYFDKKARGYCTQNGQLAKTCYGFFTTYKTPGNTPPAEVEHQGTIEQCLVAVTGSSPSVYAGERLLSVGANSNYASECLRMMDVALGASWRKSFEERKARAAFANDVEAAIRSGFHTKCGTRAWLEGAGGITVVTEKKSTGSGVFLTKKNPDGDTVTVQCSGKVVTTYASGGSMTTEPKTEAGLAAERNLRACALEKAKYVCRGGKNDFEMGMSECVRAAEAACGH